MALIVLFLLSLFLVLLSTGGTGGLPARGLLEALASSSQWHPFQQSMDWQSKLCAIALLL